ncbi:MAG: hypothetical protein K8823_1607 [Cenarchaeum symbiont of Oopsacas minuta]|nr:hypothetical protein [Cenarchaeum symbiont of Oopsacas minuta]MDI1496299.1 hypothetical protein [Cenarchaeum symbiont of Oopsacas minuta]
MRAICLITTKPGKIDSTIELIKKKRKIKKDIAIVTGRADICVFLKGTLDEINSTVINYKQIKDISSTETLVEIEVDLGW